MVEPDEMLRPCIPVTAGIATHSKVFRDDKGHFLKWAKGGDWRKIAAEVALQCAAAKVGVAPKVLAWGHDFILMQDLGDSEGVTDVREFVLSAHGMLRTLQIAGVRHRDLMPQNLIIRGGRLWVVDFGHAQWAAEPVDARFDADGDRLLRTVADLIERSPVVDCH